MVKKKAEGETGEPKAPKAKKRPSDFEILRTILQRTNERKMVYWLRNMGAPEGVYVLTNLSEEDFLYGSSEMAVSLVEFTDPELKAAAETFLGKLHGAQGEQQMLVNLRDQISEFAKTKGETFETPVESNEYGTVWTVKVDKLGKERTQYYALAIDSLFHFHSVQSWCDAYVPLLGTTDPAHLYYPYTCETTDTHSLMTLPPAEQADHPIAKLHPHGFRSRITKGTGVLVSKALATIPYPAISEEMIAFLKNGATCQVVHRITGEGWRMLTVRPNAHFLPTAAALPQLTGPMEL